MSETGGAFHRSSERAQQHGLRPWDRRAWPTKGDDDPDRLYAAVGRALSRWEKCEFVFSVLFSAFIGASDTAGAQRAYNAIRKFEDRKAMMRIAADAYFGKEPNPELQKHFDDVLRMASRLSARRHDISRGMVQEFFMPAMGPAHSFMGYGLYPSFVSYTGKTVHTLPEYCYTTQELAYFQERFLMLLIAASTVACDPVLIERSKSSLDQFHMRILMSSHSDYAEI